MSESSYIAQVKKKALDKDRTTRVETSVRPACRKWLGYLHDLEKDSPLVSSASKLGIPQGTYSKVVCPSGVPADVDVSLTYDSLRLVSNGFGFPIGLFMTPVDKKGRMLSISGMEHFLSHLIARGYTALLSNPRIVGDIIHPDFYEDVKVFYRKRGLLFPSPEYPGEVELRLPLATSSRKAWVYLYLGVKTRTEAYSICKKKGIPERNFNHFVLGQSYKEPPTSKDFYSFAYKLGIPAYLLAWRTDNEGRLMDKRSVTEINTFLVQSGSTPFTEMKNTQQRKCLQDRFVV